MASLKFTHLTKHINADLVQPKNTSCNPKALNLRVCMLLFLRWQCKEPTSKP